jgi:hypothetical protein
MFWFELEGPGEAPARTETAYLYQRNNLGWTGEPAGAAPWYLAQESQEEQTADHQGMETQREYLAKEHFCGILNPSQSPKDCLCTGKYTPIREVGSRPPPHYVRDIAPFLPLLRGLSAHFAYLYVPNMIRSRLVKYCLL